MQPTLEAPGAVASVIASADAPAPEQFDLRAGKVRFELTGEQKAVLASLPKKVAPRYASMVRQGFDRVIRAELAKGANPFEARGARFFQVACQELLAGGTTKGALKMILQERFGWSEATARSHVSVCVALLPALGAARIEGKRLVLAPSLKGHTQDQ